MSALPLSISHIIGRYIGKCRLFSRCFVPDFVIVVALVCTVAGHSRLADYADSVHSHTACFNHPTAVAVDSNSGVLYVADSQNARIRKLTPTSLPATTQKRPVSVRWRQIVDETSPILVLTSDRDRKEEKKSPQTLSAGTLSATPSIAWNWVAALPKEEDELSHQQRQTQHGW